MVFSGHQPGARAGGDDRAAQPPALRRLPVPPRVQVEALRAAPALRRLHQGRAWRYRDARASERRRRGHQAAGAARARRGGGPWRRSGPASAGTRSETAARSCSSPARASSSREAQALAHARRVKDAGRAARRCRWSSRPASTRPTAPPARASAASGLEEGLARLRDGEGARPACPSSPTSTRPGRPSRWAGWSTSSRSRPSCAGRPTWCWPAPGTARAVNVKKGQFLAPARHAPRGGQVPRGRDRERPAHRARRLLRLRQPGGGHARPRHHARAGRAGLPRRHPLGAAPRRRRRRHRRRAAVRGRRWPGPRRRWASTPSSPRSTRTRPRRSRDGPNSLDFDMADRLLADVLRIRRALGQP